MEEKRPEGKKPFIPLEAGVAITLMVIILIMSAEGFIREDIPEMGRRFPIFVFAMIGLIGTLEVVRSVKAARAKAAQPLFENFRNFIVISILSVVYCISMYYIGFITATILFFIVFIFFFKFKRPVLFCVCSAAAIIAVYCAFTQLLHIRLPVGELLETFF